MRNRLLIPITLCALCVFAGSVQAGRDARAKKAEAEKVAAATVKAVAAGTEETEQTRSVEGDVTTGTPAGEADKITFGPTAFAGHNQFYMGASNVDGAASADTQTYALSRVQLKRNAGTWAVELKPLAPVGSALNDSTVKFLTMGANKDGQPRPVVALGDAADSSKAIYLVNDVLTGDVAQLKNSGVLKDSQGGDIPQKAVHGLAATGKPVGVKNYIFAAVAGNAAWNASANNRRAVAIVEVGIADNTLTAKKPADITQNAGTGAGNASHNISFENNALLAHGSAAAPEDAATVPSMYWDDQLGRLYVAQKGVKLQASAAGRHVYGVFMGKIDANVFTLEKVTDLASGNIGAGNAANSIIAAENNNNIYNYLPRVMHTSTGKDYLIVAGGAAVSADKLAVNTWVNALPLVHDGAEKGKIGKVAAVPTNAFEYIADGALPTVDRTHGSLAYDSAPGADHIAAALDDNEQKIVVGADPRFISSDTKQLITDMHVVGDSVYVSLAKDATDKREENAGIFSSRAIFDANGNVASWTPWQREGGYEQKVAGFGIDPNTNMAWYLEGDANTKAVATIWNSGDRDDASLVHAGEALSKVLPVETFGQINGLFSFDADTPGFKARNPATNAVAAEPVDQLAVMVATGNSKVALIDAGHLAARGTAGVFETTQKFISRGLPGQGTLATTQAADDVFIFDSSVTAQAAQSGALAALGQITTAELARNVGAASGWLFVGGQGGIAVLRYDDGTATNKGEGFIADGATSLAQLLPGVDNANPAVAAPDNYPGGANWKWVQLITPAGASFNDVRKIVTDGVAGFVYVLTRTALYRFNSTAAEFATGTLTTGAAPAAGNFKTIIDISAESLGGSAAIAGGIPVGTSPAGTNATNYAGANKAFVLDKNFDELYDVMLVKSDRNAASNTTTIALATSRGVIVSNEFKDAFTGAAAGGAGADNPFFKVPQEVSTGAGGDLILGPALRFEFVNSLRGGQLKSDGADVYTAEGNLYVTALDQNMKYAAVYRFAVSDGTVTAVKEPYKTPNPAGGAQINTDYFYKIGDIDEDAQLQFSGPMDFVAKANEFGSSNSDFVSAVPTVPNPSAFLNAGQNDSAITISKTPITGIARLGGKVVTDSASGAKYIAGEFGVLVNE